MLRSLFLFFCLSLSVPVLVAAAPAQYAFRISFRDKAGAPNLSNAPAWLSARSMARRAAYNVQLDSTDRPVSPLYVDSVLRASNGKLHNTSRWLNHCVVLVTDTGSMAALRSKSWVRNVEWVGYFANGLHQRLANSNNPKMEAVFNTAPATPTTARTGGSQSYYGAAWPQTDMVHGDTLHDQGLRGKGKLIAVLDEGFEDVDLHRGFDTLRSQGRILETYNFVLDTSYVYSYSSHGTNCFSDIAGLIPGQFVGTAPDASYALYVTEDGNFTDAIYEMDNLIAGMERADSLGADLLSVSLGYNYFVSPYPTGFSKAELDGKTTIVARAVNMATAKGMLYVTSAGNEGGNAWNYLMSPGDADSALTIGAVTAIRNPAGFTSPGPNAAGRVKPDVSLQGSPAVVLNPGGSFGYSSGTSFACPQAAGYAADLMQAFPTLYPAHIREAFHHISHLYTSPTPQLGYGIPDFRKAQKYLRQFLPNTDTQELRIYPNPFDYQITVLLPTITAVADVRLYDVTGRKVGFTEQRDVTLDGCELHIIPATGMSAGIYILSVVCNNQHYIRKLVRR